VGINGGWADSGNLIVGGPIDHRGGYDTMLEIVVGLTQPHKTGL